MTFWERLDKEIEAKTSRPILTESLGLSSTAVSVWTKRQTYPAADVLVRVAEFLGVSVEWLVTGKETSHSVATMVARRPLLENIITRLEHRSDAELARVLIGLDAILGPEEFALESGMAAESTNPYSKPESEAHKRAVAREAENIRAGEDLIGHPPRSLDKRHRAGEK